MTPSRGHWLDAYTGGKHMTARNSLRLVKVGHTIVWAIFAACILAIPVLAWVGQQQHAAALIMVVLVELLVLLVNHGNCPLTAVAARYTTDRRDNFDIYLPQWLARYNKLIFGSIYLFGVALTFLRSTA
ncbi:MAG TPA: hypothetical protein VJ299_14380 [Steroidobacteraceae bacterium]|jgi:hypothetical protein|nr:hypothetical protein [Steroidobacteraceae bacterium]